MGVAIVNNVFHSNETTQPKVSKVTFQKYQMPME